MMPPAPSDPGPDRIAATARRNDARRERFSGALILLPAGIFCVLAAVICLVGRRLLPAEAQPAFLMLMAVFGISCLACILGASLWLAAHFRASVQTVLRVASGMESGADPALNSQDAGPLSAVAESIRELGQSARQRVQSLEAELEGLKAILSAMEEGLVVVDSGKRVLMVNAAARKILNIGGEDLVGRPLDALTRQAELRANLELSLQAGQTCSFEFQFTAADPRESAAPRHFVLARCSPYSRNPGLKKNGEPQGALAVLHDITELRRLERVRTEFVANVSHELRTPLTSLLGYLETLHEGGWAEPESQKFLLVCRRQAERLSRIVEDLLRLSRLENPQQDVAAAEIDLVQIAGSAVDQCRSLAGDRGIGIELQLPGEAAPILGDRGLLVQALSNLIENAINYNRDKGRVTVRLSRYGSGAGQWEVAVEDSGIGIPQESLGRIFERFYRVDKARSRERGGTGLGLSIVRHIALAHGASVHVESTLEKGSTFTLRFKSP